MLHYILAQVSIQYFKKKHAGFLGIDHVRSFAVPWVSMAIPFKHGLVHLLFSLISKCTAAAIMKPPSLCFARRGEV